MKTMKKSLSVLLSLLMALSVFSGLTITASAADPIDWTTSNSLPADPGSYVLQTDVTLSSTWYPVGETTLDLNGHGIRFNSSGSPIIRVQSGKTLTICDSDPTGTTHYFDVDSYGLAINVNDTSGTNSFTGGYITNGNFSNDRGGALSVLGGTVNFTGGTMLGNKAGWGGAIYMADQSGVQGSVNMSGNAVIMYNTSRGSWTGGGGVYIENATFTMTGGKVCHNTSQYRGGGVFVGSIATFNLYGGSITNNVSGYSGGNQSGGGVFYEPRDPGDPKTAYFNIAGNPVVKDNVIYNTKTENLNVQPGRLVMTGALTDGAYIGLSTSYPPTASSTSQS